MSRFFTIMSFVLLFMVGGQSVCRAADSWRTLEDCGTELSSDGKTLLHSLIADIKPFHAWIGGVVEDMEIVSTSTGIKLVGKQADGNERIYDLRGIEMKTEKGIYIKGGKVRVKK